MALAVALNVASRVPCSCYALLDSALLNVSANAPLRSFLAPVISLSPPSWLLIVWTAFAAVFGPLSKWL